MSLKRHVTEQRLQLGCTGLHDSHEDQVLAPKRHPMYAAVQSSLEL